MCSGLVGNAIQTMISAVAIVTVPQAIGIPGVVAHIATATFICAMLAGDPQIVMNAIGTIISSMAIVPVSKALMIPGVVVHHAAVIA